MIFAGPDYFRTLGIPLQGSDFGDDDRFGAPLGSVIINSQFTREFFGGADPIGREFAYGNRRARIIGVSGNTKYRTMRDGLEPIFYVPVLGIKGYGPVALLQIRSAGEVSKAAGQVQTLIREMEPRIPLPRISLMESEIDEALARERILAFLSVVLGAIAMVLSAVGFYAVMWCSIVRRTRETGIRMAIGAGRAQILAQFLRENAPTILLGVGLGLPIALASGRLAASLLYGLQPLDARTAIAASVLLVAVAVCAALIPAFRATRTDPAAALRHE